MDLRTVVIAVIAATVTAGAPAVAHGVHAAFAHNADKVDGKHAVGSGSTLANAGGRLVAASPSGRFASKFMTLPTVVPPGQTLRGSLYNIGESNAVGDFSVQDISFGVRMPAVLTPHVLDVGDPPTAECPGVWDSPQAQPGHLCVYESSSLNVDAKGFEWNQRSGIGFWIRAPAAGLFFSVGGWAATAPTGTSAPTRGGGAGGGVGPTQGGA